MNCEHHTPNPQTDNELICTACSPKPPCEQPANNSNQPMPSAVSRGWSEELFTALASRFPACEEVYVFKKQKNRPNGRPLRWRKIYAQVFCGTAAFFALAASFLRLM
jgi:hypothetical protein